MITSMDPTVAAAWIALIPEAAALLLVTVVLVLNRHRFADLLGRVSKVGVGGIEISLATAELKRAKHDEPVSDDQATVLGARISRAAELVRRARLLWVDDQPANNQYERRYLRSAGMTIVNATTTDDALRVLDEFDFDVVITDMSRPESATAGLDLARRMRSAGHDQPVVAYVGRVDRGKPTPVELFGITARPDDLVHLILDALERTPLASSAG
jgi:CheY-like chemotaxis protein